MIEFLLVYRLYRRGGHGVVYCLKTAYRIAVRGADF
jgi:hypothetical protein